jgi:CRISPR-associated protein Cas5h
MQTVSSGGLKLQYEKHPSEMDKGKIHQRVAHTMLMDAEYRINVWLSSDEQYAELRDRLQTPNPYYTPSLGLSECLASIECHGEYSPEPVDPDSMPVDVDSAVPSSAGSVTVTADTQLTTEQTPAEMEQANEEFITRRTTAYTAYQYRDDAEPLTVETGHAAVVDGQTVIFK